MSGILNKSKTYLIGPMQDGKNVEQWRDEITEKLKEIGVICLSPTKDCFINQVTENKDDREYLLKLRQGEQYDEIKDYMKKIVRRDLKMLDFSLFVIARIEPDVMSWGSSHEITLALQQRKPMLFLIDLKKKFPLWLLGLVNHNFIFEKMDDLVDYLKRVNDGTEPIDDKYWKILKEEYR